MSPKGDLIGIAENDGTSCEKKILLSTLSMSGYLTNRNDWGRGRKSAPLLYGYPKAQQSTFKIGALRIFLKIDIFGENKKKVENSLFRNQTFHPKKARQNLTEAPRTL